MSDLHVERWGEGARVVLVHGSISTGVECWQQQRPLAQAGFELVVWDRRGYGGSPGGIGEDYRQDGRDAARLLGDGAHLVGHSYGGLGAVFAAAQEPQRVRSLTLVEPPAFAVCRDAPVVASFVRALRDLGARRDLADRAFVEAFLRIVGVAPGEVPAAMLEHLAGRVGPLRHGRPSWEAELPLDAIGAAPFATLVVSGAHHAAFDAVCDELTQRLGADRAVIAGAGHEVQMTGRPFNDTLLSFWRRATPADDPHRPPDLQRSPHRHRSAVRAR